jgi:hypothetical protein
MHLLAWRAFYINRSIEMTHAHYLSIDERLQCNSACFKSVGQAPLRQNGFSIPNEPTSKTSRSRAAFLPNERRNVQRTGTKFDHIKAERRSFRSPKTFGFSTSLVQRQRTSRTRACATIAFSSLPTQAQTRSHTGTMRRYDLILLHAGFHSVHRLALLCFFILRSSHAPASYQNWRN